MAGSSGAGRVETLTILFTDLVNSTGLRVRVGEEAADQLRERHDRIVRSGIVRYGGRVVKSTGDGVMAAFTGASDALAAAVAVQQDVDVANSRRTAEPHQVRIGVSAGDVTLEGEDCFGLPVVEAQRLEAVAQPGQILVSSLVSALARGRGGHVLRPVGALELKGLDHPLQADEVVWTPKADDGPPIEVPPALIDRRAFPFAGRAKEAELLAGAWSAARTGATRLVLIAGEPGIGKTRLASEAATMVAADGGVVLAGRCDELVSVPYQPFAEALRFSITRLGGADALGPAPGELVRLVPEVADVRPGLPAPLAAEPDAERLRLFEAVRGWLAEVADGDPVMFVVDDLHWAEAGTLLLLRHVAVSDPVPRMVIVGTYRDTELDRTRALSGMLGDLRRRGDVTRISLDGLDAGGVTELMSLAAGHELETDAAALALALQAETGGNPFFVSEVLRHLAESGAIVYSAGRWTAGVGPGDLPEGVREVVGRRVSALPDETQAVLARAAVIGVDFELGLLAAVAEIGEDALIDALESALAAHLIVEIGVGRYRFAHALVRSTLHGELTTTRRARVHRAVAQAIETLHGGDLDSVAADLAYHWAEASPATANEHAITYAQRAGELAYARVAPEEAARWYRQARELLDGTDSALDAQLACRIGLAEALGGTDGWQATLLDAARAAEAIGDVVLMTRALTVSRRSALSEDSPEPADQAKIALLERALVLASDQPRLAAELSGALAVELIFTGDQERRIALTEANTRYRDTLDDPAERLRIDQLAARGYSWRLIQQRLSTRMPMFVQGLARARELGDHDLELWALLSLQFGSMMLGDADRDEYLAQMDAALAVYPHPMRADETLLVRMACTLADGRIPEAEEVIDALEAQWMLHGRGPEADVYVSSGRLQVARERMGLGPLADAITASPTATANTHKPFAVHGLRALALAEAGRLDEGLTEIAARGAQGFRDIPDDAGRPLAVPVWAEAAALCGAAEACRAMYDILMEAPDIHHATGGWYLGSTSRYIALVADALGRPGEADECFAKAVDAHIRMRTPPWLARTRVDWAESLLRRGDADRARNLAAAAIDDIGGLELTATRSRAQALLARS